MIISIKGVNNELAPIISSHVANLAIKTNKAPIFHMLLHPVSGVYI